MDNNHRINQTSITPTVPRQTPKNDFGQVMARAISGAVNVGAGVASGLAMGNPLLSAAVSTVSSAAQAISSKSAASVTSVGGTPGTVVDDPTGKGDDWDLLEAQKLMRSEDRRFNLEYLSLQNAMQKESREFNAVSNIMKVRHDSAKAAINNIR
ncbi:MAG: hypothetical protein IRZ16_07245 [Myxococcaceae bacterium]|nr:hypothetical protein [Myxococcaceae bacterium]